MPADKYIQEGNYAEVSKNLGAFAVYIHALLLVEGGDYAMGEDGFLLMPEQRTLDGYYTEGIITRGTYG